MKEEKKYVNKFLFGLFNAGYLLFFSFPFLTRIPFHFQPILGGISALFWFITSFIASQNPKRLKQIKNLPIRALCFGIIEIILALLFLTSLQSKSWFAWFGQITNALFCSIGLMSLYIEVFYYFFPSLIEPILKPPSNPLDKFPKATQDIANKGSDWVGGSFALSTISFLVIGLIGDLLLLYITGDKSDTFLIICFPTGLLLGLILSIIAIFKWQKYARRSGIPEEELKAAAKAAKLWWPKTKEE